MFREPNMMVNLGRGLILKNPVLAASGTFGYGTEYDGLLDLSLLGGIVVKGLSLRPRTGNKPPRMTETPAGMLNSIGLQNIGVDAFVHDKLPRLLELGAVIIANVYAETIEEFGEVCSRLDRVRGLAALEINVSCPNVKKGGIAFGSDPEVAGAVTRTVRQSTDLPIIIKLSPNVTDIVQVALAVEEAGADAVTAINTIKGMAIDVETRRPKLANIIGGLSGPAIRPIAVRMVWEVAQKIKIPIIGGGGIMVTNDALEFFLAGARAVEVGTANFIDPLATIKIAKGIHDYLGCHQIPDISHLVGSLQISLDER